MGLFGRKQKDEQRAEEITVSDVLLQALLGGTSITKKEAMSIPSVAGCVKFAADTVSMMPIKLYEEKDGKVHEIKDDIRIRLLNDDTGDTLDAVQFWRAIITDYYMGKGGYAYINKGYDGVKSLHYVDESHVSTIKNTNQIFKDYDILVDGVKYKPFDFIKILRNTKDGAEGVSITSENELMLSVAYNSLLFEENTVKKGGNKKGFLKSPKKLTDAAITALKAAFRRLYSNNSENVVVLNEGIEFQEASNTSVEMQMNENKESNGQEICKIFNFPVSIIKGTATEKDYSNAFKTGIIPLLKAIECALNRDMLLEKEKQSYYYAFDTKELLKGSIKERFEAYKVAIESNFLQIDEVRYLENYEPLGIEWIKIGLDSVLYNPKTGEMYTPNTNETKNMRKIKGKGGDENEDGD